MNIFHIKINKIIIFYLFILIWISDQIDIPESEDIINISKAILFYNSFVTELSDYASNRHIDTIETQNVLEDLLLNIDKNCTIYTYRDDIINGIDDIGINIVDYVLKIATVSIFPSTPVFISKNETNDYLIYTLLFKVEIYQINEDYQTGQFISETFQIDNQKIEFKFNKTDSFISIFNIDLKYRRFPKPI